MLGKKLFGLIPVLGLMLAIGGTASAASNIYPLIGALRLINATGQTIDSAGNIGGIGLSGLITFNSTGGASSVNLTLTYEDNSVWSGVATDVFTCVLTNPADITYTLSPAQTGVGTSTSGTLDITVGWGD